MNSPSAVPDPRLVRLRIAGNAAAFDTVAILVFVVIGRFNHDDGLSPAGIFSTFWPFAVGAALGWAVGYLIAQIRSGDYDDNDFAPDDLVPEGLIIWILTVAIGMVMRDQFGQGIEVSFIIVATIVLGLFLIGWRVVRRTLARRAAK